MDKDVVRVHFYIWFLRVFDALDFDEPPHPPPFHLRIFRPHQPTVYPDSIDTGT